MNINEESINAISELGRKFSDTTIVMHEAIAQRAGLTGSDHKYLGLLMQNGAMTAGELAKLTGLTTGAITGVIDRLEKKNLVQRTFDKDDRRKIVIVPNRENAMQLMGGSFADLQSKMIHLFSSLSEKEAKTIEKYLRSTIAVMQEVTHNLEAGLSTHENTSNSNE